jgi:O-antigen/teichoic acid export membrane protein
MTIIITYAFPLFCRDDSRQLQGQLKRISIIQYPITLLISLGLGAVVLWLYQYPVSLALYLCLSLFCAVQFHSQIKAWYFAGQGTDATRRLLGAQILSLCVNVAVLLILVPHVGVLSGGIALLAAGCAMLGYLYHLEKR